MGSALSLLKIKMKNITISSHFRTTNFLNDLKKKITNKVNNFRDTNCFVLC